MELFCFRRYLETLATNGLSNYPCAITMGESPDFMIMFSKVIRGLEITQATTEAFQSTLTKLERECHVPKSLDDGWLGDEPEHEWCTKVLDAVSAKVAMIKGYRPAEFHDILVYSNHPADVVRAIGGEHPEHSWLQERARQCSTEWQSERKLGTISVIDGGTLLYDLIGRCDRWTVKPVP